MRTRALALTIAGVALGIWGYRQFGPVDSTARAVASVAVAWAFLAAGLAAWFRRPTNRVGPLMVWVAFALLLRKLRYSHEDVLFTFGFLLGELNFAAFAHVVLAYPTGRLERAAERWAVRVGYLALFLFPLAGLLVYDASARNAANLPKCTRSCPDSVISVTRAPEVFRWLQHGERITVFGLLGAVFLVLIATRIAQATPRARRMLVPLYVAGFAAGLRALSEVILAFTNQSRSTREAMYWTQIAVELAVPVVLLVGLLRTQLARAGVADLVVELGRTPPEGVRDALARALGDPSLDVAFWLPERRVFVDAGGRPVTLPGNGDARAVTKLAHEGEPVAALVHDPALLEEPGLLDAAGAAARLSLHNARLHAEVRAQLAKVQESRARIVAAGDAERRRIERDLHDGAQQRLVALALDLRMTERELVRTSPVAANALRRAVDELHGAVEELRELAHGVHPAILTEEGLGPALRALADRTPLPVSIVNAPDVRLPPEIEAAAYFVTCEAVANAVKHAKASVVSIRAERTDGALCVEIGDDGVGGADLDGGTGLRGLADRVEAHGGRLIVDSTAGKGTTVIAEIPCAS